MRKKEYTMTDADLVGEREILKKIVQISNCLERYKALRGWFGSLSPEAQRYVQQRCNEVSNQIIAETKNTS